MTMKKVNIMVMREKTDRYSVPIFYFSQSTGASITLRNAGIDKNLIIELNDSGFTFDEIANYIDGFTNT
jgi:hypothetical protein